MPGGQDLIVAQEAEIMTPAPFLALSARQPYDFGSGNVL